MYVSADGKNWSIEGDLNVPIGDCSVNHFDTEDVMMWDPKCDCYSFYARCDYYRKGAGPTYDARMVRRAQSELLQPWTDDKPNPFDHGAGWDAPFIGHWVNDSIVMRADAQDIALHPTAPPPPGSPAAEHPTPVMDYYGQSTFFVGDSTFGVYFMAAVRYFHWGPKEAEVIGGDIGDQPGTYDIALAVSRDGESFEFLAGRKPWLRPGMEGSVGSRRMSLASPGPVRVGDEELYFVAKTNVAELSRNIHNGPTLDPLASQWQSEIGVGRLRLNGLVSLDAPYLSAATLITKPFIFTGRRLLVNANAGGGGSLTLELYRASAGDNNSSDHRSTPLLTSVPLTHNGVKLEVQWDRTPRTRGNASACGEFAGIPVRMTMRLRDCSIYSFQFVE